MKPATKTWAELIAEWEKEPDFAQLVEKKLQEYRHILSQLKSKDSYAEKAYDSSGTKSFTGFEKACLFSIWRFNYI